MSKTIKGINTQEGVMQIDFNSLANLPTINGQKLEGNIEISSDSASLDVQIDGTSIVTDGVVNIPVATKERLGVIRVDAFGSLTFDANGMLSVKQPVRNGLVDRSNVNHDGGFISTTNYDDAVKKHLTDNVAPAYTSEEKAMAQNRIGLGEYRTLFDVTLEEQVGAVTFNTDMDGNPFEVEEVIIIIENCQVENGRIRVIDTTNKFNDFVNLYFNNSNTTTPKKHVITIGKQVDGTHCVERMLTDNTGTAFETISQPPWRAYGRRNVKYLTRFQIDNNGGNFSVGTRIWVGGR